MEQRPLHFRPDPKYKEKLLPYIPKRPHYMDRSQRTKGKYVDKWHLIVPLEIYNKTWEEPNADDI